MRAVARQKARITERPRSGWPALSAVEGPWLAGLALLTAIAFAGVRGHAFINFDDPQYVTDNATVAAGITAQGFAWAFTSTYAGNWHPLTWLSHMLDVELFGMRAGAHHVVSAALHVINTLLIFLLFARTTGSRVRSAVVAALFAVHPLHVESVAWVAERKDVLSTLFWLLALLAYARYVSRPGKAAYAWVAILFALGLLSKPMVVTLPVTLLVLDIWPLRRALPWRQVIVEKLPFFAMSAAATVITFIAQRSGGAVAALDMIPLGARLTNAVVTCAAYLWKTIWPAGLAPFYPYRADAGIALFAGCALLIAALSTLAWMVRRRAPYVTAGWLWYIVTLLPVIGLIQVGSQAMADRYTYVPLIGIFAAAVWAAADLTTSRLPSIARAVAAGAIVALLSVLTIQQTRHWRNAIDLWTHASRVMPGNHRAHNNLGQALIEEGRAIEAEHSLREAVRLFPQSAESQHNLGAALADQGRHADAIGPYEAAIALNPSYAEALGNLGTAFAHVGRFDDAVRTLEEAARIERSPAMLRNLAIAHNQAGAAAERTNRDGAIAHYRAAMQAAPQFPDPYVNLARLHFREGREDDALAAFLAGQRANARDAELHYGAGVIHARRGELPEAARQFQQALSLDPRHEAARAGFASVSRGLSGRD